MRNLSYHIITLGCPKNEVDSDYMAGVLNQQGLIEEKLPERANIIIVNTCGFIYSAQQQSLQTIVDVIHLKKITGAFLIVTGCFAQRYGKKVAEQLPSVDAWMGLEDIGKIGELVQRTVKGEKVVVIDDRVPQSLQGLPRRYSSSDVYGYVKIADGCSHSCSFCSIPKIKGQYRSLPIEVIERETKDMIQKGIREIVLVAQDTTLYGIDLYGKKSLANLMKRLVAIEEVGWLRLMYAYPTSMDDEILEVMAVEPKICKYIDIPLQHSAPEVLKKMGRPPDSRNTVEKVRKWIPDVAIRTCFITGHPGETEAHFLDLVQFVRDMKFYNVGVFVYSPEEDTTARALRPMVTKKEAKKRRNHLLSVQQEISLKLRHNRIGTTVPAVCEKVLKNEKAIRDFKKDRNELDIPPGTTAVCRSMYDAPEVDGLLYIQGTSPTERAFFSAKITEAQPYDLIGTAVTCQAAEKK